MGRLDEYNQRAGLIDPDSIRRLVEVEDTARPRPPAPATGSLAAWDKGFLEAWSALEVKFDPSDAEDPEGLGQYRGTDFSISNAWVGSGGVCFIGAPYRKEVSPNDDMGTYQRVGFRVKDGIFSLEEGEKSWADNCWFGDRTFSDLDGESLATLYPDPKAAVAAVDDEIELMY